MTIRILTVAIKTELDIVAARQRAREIASICGFASQDQARIATSISELARNVYNYAGNGKVHFTIEGETAPQILTIYVEDKGPGIDNLDEILSGNYVSATGMGKGILGARRLMDRFDIKTSQRGTEIILQKLFPRDAKLITPKMSGSIFSQLSILSPEATIAEVLHQNTELLHTLAESKARQDDLIQLTRELEDTNRGVVALYAELDEKAEHLRRADAMKSRFLSNMSHEFRTPLSSIRALSKLLLDRIDGDLTIEQEKQVLFILQGALGLTDLVNDLLDLAKIEAGKIDIRPHTFNVAEMFSALRGMLRPLLISESLDLNFVEPNFHLEMFTDEAKLSQILRNFISNALKFTEAGEITVNVSFMEREGLVKFTVKDTGLGIDENDQKIIFEEFSQLENSLQQKVKGTGLGLPLCKNLATLLNGSVAVESTPGVGSIFSVTLPQHYSPPTPKKDLNRPEPTTSKKDDRLPILVVEDNASTQLLYQKFFADTEFRVVIANTVRQAKELWSSVKPLAVILDIFLQGETAWPWLAEIKNDPVLRRVPVIVATEIEDKRKGLSLGADAYYVKPIFKQQLISTIRTLIGGSLSQPPTAIAAQLK
ncbi:MAG: response regulator [Gammaproteobacteria bacterium]|nr:MAG: response regulator [Gammaproteobacteria bacterium]